MQLSVRTMLSLTLAVLPYLSCVKKRVGMHTCESLWVVIMLLVAAYILISNMGGAETYCNSIRPMCDGQVRDALMLANNWQCDAAVQSSCVRGLLVEQLEIALWLDALVT
eukprot:3117952-Heterocapsa_arctica.AAC.1